MEEKKVLEGKLFVEAYKNIVDSINGLDVEDKTEEINKEIESLKKKEKPDDDLMKHSENRREDYERTEYLVDDIKKQEKKINELKKVQKKVSENKRKVQFLDERRQTVRKNLKNNKDNEIKNREKEINDLKLNIEANKEKIEEEKVGRWKKELQEIEEIEKSDPHRARDEKYKEYLRNKISSGLAELESQLGNYQQQIDNLQNEIKIINKEYTSILKNFGRIDRGEKIQINNNDNEKDDDTQLAKKPQMEKVADREPDDTEISVNLSNLNDHNEVERNNNDNERDDDTQLEEKIKLQMEKVADREPDDTEFRVNLSNLNDYDEVGRNSNDNERDDDTQDNKMIPNGKIGLFRKILNKIKSVFKARKKDEKEDKQESKKIESKSKKEFHDNFKMSSTYMSISDKLKNAKTAEQVKQVLEDAKGLIGEGEGKISHAEYSGLIYNAKAYGAITGDSPITAIDLQNKDNYHDKKEVSNDSDDREDK